MRRFATIVETVPTPCRIFGTVLRPFCLGHHLLLVRLGLPYADNPDAKGTFEQFLQAVFLCAHSFEDNLSGLLAGDWAAKQAQWVKAVKKSRPDFAAGRALFTAHLEAGYRIAPVWRYSSSGGISLSAPWEELLKCRLVSAGFMLSDVLNGYLPERWYDYFTVMELQAAATCADAKQWKRIFYTLKDALDDEVASQPVNNAPAPAPEVEPI